MTAAIALAVVLVVVVAGLSLAMQSQRGASPVAPRSRRPAPGPRRPRERRPPAPPPAPPPPEEPGPKGPELLRTGTPGEARVISVVDERTIGPVTRSRLTLQVELEPGTAFEVTTRVAFPTPEARARVKVGGTVPIRYDKDDHTRLVVDLPATG